MVGCVVAAVVTAGPGITMSWAVLCSILLGGRVSGTLISMLGSLDEKF